MVQIWRNSFIQKAVRTILAHVNVKNLVSNKGWLGHVDLGQFVEGPDENLTKKEGPEGAQEWGGRVQ